MGRRLVLWDIDGTLVQAGEVGRDIFTEAFQAVVGRDPDQVTGGRRGGRVSQPRSGAQTSTSASKASLQSAIVP